MSTFYSMATTDQKLSKQIASDKKVFVKIFNDISISIDDMISYIENHPEYIFTNNPTSDDEDEKIIEFINNDRGLKLFLSDRICHNGDKIKYVFKNIENEFSEEIENYIFDYMIHNFNPRYFYLGCLYYRLNLVKRLYAYDNNVIKYTEFNDCNSNVFMASLYSENLETMKYIHSIDNTLYKQLFSDPIINLCQTIAFITRDLEIMQWLHSIDNTIFTEYTYSYMSTLNRCIYEPKNIEIIKFLFSIDNNIFNKDPKKENILKYLSRDGNKSFDIQVIDLIHKYQK